MITIILLLSISLIVLGVGFAILSLGGAVFTIIFSDLLIAIGIIWILWFIFHRKKKNNN